MERRARSPAQSGMSGSGSSAASSRVPSGSVVGVRQQRHSMERDLVPRKRRLEALKELDAP